LRALRDDGLNVTTTQLRWSITSGKVSRPPLDGSLRFDFSEQHLNELREYFRSMANCKRRGRRSAS